LDKIKNFVSEHTILFETLSEVFLGLLYIAWAILMLYQFSGILLSGIEKDSAILLALGIAGYIFIAWYTYWVTFARRHDDDFREIQRDIWQIRFRQSSHYLDDTLSRSEFKVTMIERKMSEDDLKYKLEALDRKIDKLIEQK
jgi:hypothetical protein